jgi:predicted O-methyltransferase YrrM
MCKIRHYLGLVFRYIRYYARAKTRYDVDAPFIAGFVEEILEDRRYFQSFEQIEGLRNALMANSSPLNVVDYGAGPRAIPSRARTVGRVVRSSAISPAAGRYLFRACLYYLPSTILEMGTSLGISGLYLRMARKGARMFSLEGCPETAALARKNFERASSADIALRIGPFAQTLPEVLTEIHQLDLLYLDGDHRGAQTWDYFVQCMEKAHPKSVFILADIHWSEDMEQVWNRICQHHKVRLSIDLFEVGFLFFDEDLMEKQAWTLIPWRYKPWRLGIFR